MLDRGSVDLDPKDEEDRALLQAMPAIAAALLSHIARDPKHIMVVFSTRKHDTAVRVFSTNGAWEPLDDELARATVKAPKMPMVRVVSLRRDGAALCRDVRVTALTDAEETAPS